MVQPYSDSVSIAATTAGVTGTITVMEGARLVGMNLSFNNATGQPQIIELTWAGCPTPLRFVPSIMAQPQATSGASSASGKTPLIPLNVVVDKATIVTLKITSNANVTVVASLFWT